MQACSAVWAGVRHCTKSSAWSYVHHISCTISHREACCGGVHPAACQHCIWYKSRQFIIPTDITLSIECACNNSQLCPLGASTTKPTHACHVLCINSCCQSCTPCAVRAASQVPFAFRTHTLSQTQEGVFWVTASCRQARCHKEWRPVT